MPPEIEHVERPGLVVVPELELGRLYLKLCGLIRNHGVVRLRKGLPPRAAAAVGGKGELWFCEVHAYGRHFIGEGETLEHAIGWVVSAVAAVHDRITE